MSSKIPFMQQPHFPMTFLFNIHKSVYFCKVVTLESVLFSNFLHYRIEYYFMEAPRPITPKPGGHDPEFFRIGASALRGVHPSETMMHFPLFQISFLFSKNCLTLWTILNILLFPDKFFDFRPPKFLMTFF